MTFKGRVLDDRYRLTGRIATGGMGEVWRAADDLLRRDVAVKLLRQHVAADPEFRERFRNEARITAGLSDPGIAQVYDYGEQEGVAYLVMELVPGEPLSGILARNDTLSAEVTLDVVAQTARALHAAHRAGIIHRDIKPGNILVTETGSVKITDFGIARVLEGARMTMTGTVLGTAHYVSPEQASGSTLGPATDIYSLGVVAYECLAGRPPFTGGNQVAIALLHLNEQVPPLPATVPAPVRELVGAMLAKAPEHRPASARELADRAVALRGSPATPAAPPLSMLTDPAGFAVREALEARRDPFDGLYDTPAAGSAGTASARPATTAAGPAGARHPALPGARRQGRRRSAISIFAVAGCAAVVGIGVLAAGGGPGDGPEAGPPPSSGPATGGAVRTPSPSRVATTSRAPRPVKSARPSVSRSATVSRTATPSRPAVPTPTPKPTPTPTPEPTVEPTPSTTLSPSTSASTTITPNGKT
ncbi:hypothetical protein Sru01_26670 [Sphaerisporangium rufum]|uniref:non-specific serine/threonine protein kinase n=1 Tax=Sphaerisporangium rufum TaxID=1381558 RepID=A0A919V4X0_9ACTN|nr:serine/threonine-protein kinase [Sphaerisporangium rufum]GII77685.1 hypothetical protein Sru01_26670 [Sphaerisporangium rufum]